MAGDHRKQGAGTVFSSEHGRICPHCSLPIKRCACRANPRGSAGQNSAIHNSDGDGIARVGRSSKGRGGKTVTLVTGLQLPDAGSSIGWVSFNERVNQRAISGTMIITTGTPQPIHSINVGSLPICSA